MSQIKVNYSDINIESIQEVSTCSTRSNLYIENIVYMSWKSHHQVKEKGNILHVNFSNISIYNSINEHD